jgi:hypothetical protein
MVRIPDRITPRNLLRWSLYAVFFALTISIVPDYWTAERLPPELQPLRGLSTLAMLVLTVLLIRARYGSDLRKFWLQTSIVTLILLEAMLKVGVNAQTVALLVVWVVVALVEWRRLVEEERQFI